MKSGLGLLLVTLSLMPRPTVGLAAPGDIVFERPGGAQGFPAAVFPHWVHRMKFRCYVCHPKIFAMKKGASKVTMETINAGPYCGVCHGKAAFPATACARCHPAMGAK